MPVEVNIYGRAGAKNSKKFEAHVHPFNTASGKHVGLVGLTHPFIETEPSIIFFTNPSNGIAMNKAVTFGGAKLRATVVHAGVNSGNADSGTTDASSPAAFELDDTGQNFEATVGPGALVHNTTASPDTYALVTAVNSDTKLTLDTDIMQAGSEAFHINDIWVGTAVLGTWNFADGGKITITSALNNSEATFTVDADHIWNAKHFVSFTGKVDLDEYDPAVNTIVLEFGINGTLVGNSINLDDFIDIGNFDEQSFVIPIAELGLDQEQDINSMRITILRTGGTKPTIKFDDLQWENTGTPIVYTLNVDKGDKFHIQELVFAYKDNIDSIQTVAGAGENVTNLSLDPDTILGLAQLTNGFVITRTKKGVTLFSASIKDLGSHIAAGATVTEIITAPDGSSTQVILRAKFDQPLILSGDADDTLTVTINDSMNALERFTAAGRGGLETP